MKKIVASLVISCTLALSVLSASSVAAKDNQAVEKIKEVQLLKMDPGTLG